MGQIYTNGYFTGRERKKWSNHGVKSDSFTSYKS